MSTAVIIGGGFTGLATVRTLKKHFSNVILIDKRDIYNTPDPSQGHLHVLLSRGLNIFKALYPSFMSYTQVNTVDMIDWSKDTIWDYAGNSFPQYNSDIKTLGMSKELLLKYLLKQEFDFHQTTVTQINRNNDYEISLKNGKIINAKAIFYCTGNNVAIRNFLPQLLQEEILTPIHISYFSTIIPSSEISLNEKQYYFQMDPPVSSIGGVISPIENANHRVTLIIYDKRNSVKISNKAEFLYYAKMIASPVFHQAISNTKSDLSIQRFHKKYTTKAIYNKKELPPNFYILGDCHSQLNPIFGQGMTKSLMQIEVLEKLLHADKLNSKRFLILSQRVLNLPELLSKYGSRQDGFGKSLLVNFLKFAQKYKYVHQLYLNILHLNQLHRKNRISNDTTLSTSSYLGSHKP